MMHMANRAVLQAALLTCGLATLASAAPSNPVAEPLHFNAGTGFYDPPSWNSMVMVNITLDGGNIGYEPFSYDFTVGPILRAAPSNAFSTGQRCFVLNGTAFNRQLGWFDNIENDFYESHGAELDGNYLWIDRVGGSSQLKTYFVSEAGNPNGPYTPIFGTEGSPTRWLWDGQMDHNAYAVNLWELETPNQLFTADYRLYIGDGEGNEVLQADNVTPRFGSLELTWSFIGPGQIPASPPPPGDFNGDGSVTHADYTVWADYFGWAIADVRASEPGYFPAYSCLAGSSHVTHGLYTLWADSFGRSAAATVPEPASLALLALGALAILRRRK